MVVEDLHAGGFEPLTPTLVIVAAGLQARMPRTTGCVVGDRASALCELSAVEEQQDAPPTRNATPSCQPATAGSPSSSR